MYNDRKAERHHVVYATPRDSGFVSAAAKVFVWNALILLGMFACWLITYVINHM